MRHAGQVVTRTMLLENVWDYHFDPQTNVIDVHVSRLRAKIEKGFDSADPAYGARRGLHAEGRLTWRMRLPAILKTTAARLSALYLLLFALCAVLLVFYMTVAVGAHADRADAGYDQRGGAAGSARAYQRGGLPLLVRIVERRSRQPGANLYLIADSNGRILAGNVESLEPGVLEAEGWTERPFSYQRYGEGVASRRDADGAAEAAHRPHAAALVLRLPNRMIVLVGRDLGEPERFRAVVRRALIVALGIMALGGLLIWFSSGARALKRIDSISEPSQRIMGGDLSRPAAGDRRRRRVRPAVGKPQRHAGRIAELNEGLKQVSDNIAHDLKTPLTRLRNRAEAALAGNADDSGLPRGAGSDDRRIRPADPHLQRDPDDLAAGGGLFGRSRWRGRPREVVDRCRRALRTGGRGGGRDAGSDDRAGDSSSTATAN